MKPTEIPKRQHIWHLLGHFLLSLGDFNSKHLVTLASPFRVCTERQTDRVAAEARKGARERGPSPAQIIGLMGYFYFFDFDVSDSAKRWRNGAHENEKFWRKMIKMIILPPPPTPSRARFVKNTKSQCDRTLWKKSCPICAKVAQRVHQLFRSINFCKN